MAGCTRLYSLVCSFSLVSFARLVRTLIRVGNHFFAVLLGMAVLRSRVGSNKSRKRYKRERTDQGI